MVQNQLLPLQVCIGGKALGWSWGRGARKHVWCS